MAKTLTARGSDGLVSIHEQGANIDAPLTNLNNIYFHSALTYLPLAYYRDVNVNTNSAGMANLFAHGMGRPVMFMATRRDNGDFLGSSVVVYSSLRRFTSFSLCVNETFISSWVMRLGDPVNYNIPIRVYVFDVGL